MEIVLLVLIYWNGFPSTIDQINTVHRINRKAPRYYRAVRLLIVVVIRKFNNINQNFIFGKKKCVKRKVVLKEDDIYENHSGIIYKLAENKI